MKDASRFSKDAMNLLRTYKQVGDHRVCSEAHYIKTIYIEIKHSSILLIHFNSAIFIFLLLDFPR